MLPLEITPATIILGLIIIALVVVVIVRLRKRGMCDCKDCDAESCNGCGAVNKMLDDMEKAAKQ